MTRTIDAIYAGGVLGPVEPLPLREHERVRITVASNGEAGGPSREEAVRRFLEGTEK